jgi:glycosyltransferase involved in cell wall biosynthesis
MTYEQDPPQDHIVEQLYNGSSIMLSPSQAEGFPLPPAEGAACGCAVVATDIGGHREYLESGVTGLLSAPEDPKALADNLCALLGDDELRVRLAQSVNQFIRQFTWERSTVLMEDFIINAVTRKTVARSSASAVEVSPA